MPRSVQIGSLRDPGLATPDGSCSPSTMLNQYAAQRPDWIAARLGLATRSGIAFHLLVAPRLELATRSGIAFHLFKLKENALHPFLCVSVHWWLRLKNAAVRPIG